jgi:hypothetical protein
VRENNANVRGSGSAEEYSGRKIKQIVEDGEDVELFMERLTKGQRQAILERDDYTSQMRHYSEEKGFYNNEACPYDGQPCDHLSVHHVLPVREGARRGMKPEDVNDPSNLITIFSCEHTGVCPSRRIRR